MNKGQFSRSTLAAAAIAMTALPVAAVPTPRSTAGTTVRVAPTTQTASPRPSLRQVSRGALTFYSSRPELDLVAPGLTTETFSGNLVGPNNLCIGVPPLDSTTDDSCFGPGSVIPGWSLGPYAYVLLTAPQSGIGINAVGSLVGGDDTLIHFDPAVTAVGFDLLGELLSPVTAEVRIYDADDALIGSTTASGSLAGTFFGVTSLIPIARIELVASPGTEPFGNLFGDLCFGVGPPASAAALDVPALDPAGIGLLLLLLAAAGTRLLRR